MLSQIQPLLDNDRKHYDRQFLPQNEYLEDLIKRQNERLAEIKIYMRPQIMEQHPNLAAQLMTEELQKQMQDLREELQSHKQTIQELEISRSLTRKENEILQKDLQAALQEAQNLNFAAVEQANDIKELHKSRDDLIKELEQITVERNQLLEVIKNEKLKMAENLNEINELHDMLRRKEKLLGEEQQRLDRKYSDYGNKNLGLKASEEQIKQTSNADVPNIVARKLQKFHGGSEIYDIAINLNGSMIATCGGDRYVRVYDPLNLQSVSQYQSTSDEVITSLCFSPTFECLLMGSTDNTAQLWQVTGWKMKSRFVGHSDQVTAVGFVGGEKDVFVSGSNDRSLKLWSVSNGACLKTINATSKVIALACQHNAPFVISAHYDGSLRGYSMKQDSKPCFNDKTLFEDYITSITLSGDSQSAILCSKEGSCVKIYDLRMNKTRQTFQDAKYMNSYTHNRACFGPDEKYVIAGNADSSLISWKTQGEQLHKVLNQGSHEGVVLCVAYHTVSGQMFSADARGNLVIWR